MRPSAVISPFKVGLLVLAASVAFLLFFTFARKETLGGEARIVYATFKDASGLGPKSRVQTAGISVGEVAEVRLVGTKARLTLRVRRDVPLKKDATLSKRAESMLGDYLLDLAPGTEAAQPLPDGGEIVNVVDRTGLDQAFDRLNLIAADIQEVTRSLREVLGGPEGEGNLQTIMENLVELSSAMDDTIRTSGDKLNAVLENLEGFSEDVRELTAGQGENYRHIVENVRGATEDVRDVLKTVKAVVGSGEGELKESVASLKQTLGRLDAALANVEDVTASVQRGEGIVGQLVKDQELAANLSSAVGDASEYIGRLSRMLTEVTLRSEFHLTQGAAKNYLQLKLIPKPDKYYFFEIIDDPRGVTVEETVLLMPPGSEERELQTRVVTRQDLKFSVQFAKRYYGLTLRFGIIESSGGVGANLHVLDDTLSLTMDLFEFGAHNKSYPRFKAFVNYVLMSHLFLSAGIDDTLNPTILDRDLLTGPNQSLGTRRVVAGRDVFLGAGVYFTDEDLKSLFGLLSVP